MNIRIADMEDRDSLLLEQLLNVWENSVRATHFFLAEADMEDIKNMFLKH